MYEYNPFSPHNDITIANVFILLFAPDIYNLIFHEIFIIELHKPALFGILFVSVLLLFLLTLPNFVIGFWAVKFALK
jgi:hypothetical protein